MTRLQHKPCCSLLPLCMAVKVQLVQGDFAANRETFKNRRRDRRRQMAENADDELIPLGELISRGQPPSPPDGLAALYQEKNIGHSQSLTQSHCLSHAE